MWEIITIIILAAGAFYLVRQANMQPEKVQEKPKPKVHDEPGEEVIPEEDPEENMILEKEGEMIGTDAEEREADRLISDANSLFAKGKMREAEKLLIEAIKKDRRNPHAYFALGNIFFSEDNFEDSVNAYEKATEYDPMNDVAFNNLGLSHYKMKDYRSAVSAFEKATAINPDIKNRYINLALAARKDHSDKKAIKALETLNDLADEPNVKHMKMLAEAYEANGQKDKFTKVLTQILEIDPEDVDVKRKLARQ